MNIKLKHLVEEVDRHGTPRILCPHQRQAENQNSGNAGNARVHGGLSGRYGAATIR
jgi:hypothetical protein